MADNENMTDREPNAQVQKRNSFSYPSEPKSASTPNTPLATRANGKAGSHK